MKKLFVSLLLCIMMVGMASAWSSSIFNNSLTTENITFTGNENFTRWLSVPENTMVTNGFMNLSGVGTFNATGEFDDIEDSWVGPSIHLINKENAVDENWNSYTYVTVGGGSVSGIIYENYTIPTNIISANWTSKGYVENEGGDEAIRCRNYDTSGYTRWNMITGNETQSISSGCLNGDILQISTVVVWTTGGDLNHYYEGAATWYYNSSPLNPYLQINDTKIWNHTGEFNSTFSPNRTTNFASIINSYISTATAIAGYFYIPFIFHSDITGILGYSSMTFNNNGFIENSQTYNPTTIETAQETFAINLSYDSSIWNSITAKLNYAGTNYSGTQAGTGDNLNFTKSLAIPLISAEINNTFYWIVSLTNSTGTYTFNSVSYNQTVSQITFGICTGGQTPYINFTTYGATTPFPLVNATFKSSWTITDVSGGAVILNRSFEDITETNSSFAFCISPNSTNYTISVTVEVDGATLARNYYYLTDALVTNVSTTNVTLYLLNDSLATLTELEVVDESQNVMEDVIITVQFYDVGTDTFYTVAMAKTSYAGKDLVYLNWYDTFYKFIFVKDGETLYTTTPYKISETPQIFTIPSETIFEFDKFRDFEYTLVYNNVTQNFVLTFIKPSGDVDAGCLRVIKRNITNDYTICETCEASSSATIYCNIGAWGNGTFIASFYATGSFQWIANLFQTIGEISNAVYTSLGEVEATGIAIIFAGIVTSFFLISPVLGVLGVILGTIGAMLLGFQQIDYGIFWILAVIGGIVIWKLQK